MADSHETPIFSEKQYFPIWLRGLTALSMAVTIVLCIIALFHKSPESGHEPIWVILGAGVLVPLAVTALMWFFHMDTQVRSNGLYVRCFPIHLRYKHFTPSEIAESYARKYHPILEYGGWGVRLGLAGRGRAYNVSGNEGLQLIFKDGRKLLIGSHQPQQLESALHSLKT